MRKLVLFFQVMGLYGMERMKNVDFWCAGTGMAYTLHRIYIDSEHIYFLYYYYKSQVQESEKKIKNEK